MAVADPATELPPSLPPPPRPDGRWRDLVDALALFLVLRVGFALVGLVLVVNGTVPGPCHFELALNGWITIPPVNDTGTLFPLVGIWQRWDACWYSKIASFGYETGTDSIAFFPLFPFLMAAVAVPLGGNVGMAGLIVSSVSFVTAGIGILRLVGEDFGRPVAWRTLVYIAVFPASFFLLSPFTESLFLAVTVWALVFARRRRWLPAAAVAALAALTRLPGIVLVLPLAWEATMALRERRSARGGAGTPGPDRGAGRSGRAAVGDIAASAVAVVAPVLGLAAFAVAAGALVGSTPFDAQDAWGGRNFHAPWETVGAAADWVANGSTLRGIELVNLAGLILFAALGVAGLRWLPPSYSLLLWSQLFIVATRMQPVPLTSTTRLLVVMFPAFVVAAIAGRDRRFHYAWLIVSTLFLGLLVVWFVSGEFVA
jgi:hypothetical protein